MVLDKYARTGERNRNRIWAYRKAAWAVEDLEQDIGLVYRTLGKKVVESILNVSSQIAQEIETLLRPD